MGNKGPWVVIFERLHFLRGQKGVPPKNLFLYIIFSKLIDRKSQLETIPYIYIFHYMIVLDCPNAFN